MRKYGATDQGEILPEDEDLTATAALTDEEREALRVENADE